MATPAPDAVKRLVDRFDLGHKVFLSGDYKEKQIRKAKPPHEEGSLKRTIAATDRSSDALVYGLHCLMDEGIRLVEGVR